MTPTFSREQMLARMYASDPTANGQFITGVLSTGIYCLPSCSARKPKSENVRFFFTEEDAQGAGLRACRRCRPSDFYRDHDPDLATLTTLTDQIRSDSGAFRDVSDLAASSNLGQTKLHALFRRHYHLTPAAFLARERVAAACRTLAETKGRVAETAFDVGYESLSAFNENFRKQTGLTPGEYQRLGQNPEFTMALPPDFLATPVLTRLSRDPQGLSELVSGTHIVKAMTHEGVASLLHLELCPGHVHCRVESGQAISPSLMRSAHGVAIRMLGLASDPSAFQRKLEGPPDLRRLTAGREGLRIPLTADVFEGVTWSIVGQQITVPFATTLRHRLIELCGTPAPNGLKAHPAPQAVAALDYDDLTPLQFSRRKAEYLIDTARVIASGDLEISTFDHLPVTQIEKRLLVLRGFGPWSTQYVLMNACGFADCVPLGDTGLASGLKKFFALDHAPTREETLERMQAFAPFRSLATYHLWMSLG
jgi:AraC family transcriptional regulator of adaptative response / DNA-3-methyladenine glycosylase II